MKDYASPPTSQSTDQSDSGVLVDESFARIQEQGMVNSAPLHSHTVCFGSSRETDPKTRLPP